VLDDDSAPVSAPFGYAGTILDLELESKKTRHLVAKSWGLVLAAAALREPPSLGTVLAEVHHFKNITIDRALVLVSGLSA
jgi:hypothetical protein